LDYISLSFEEINAALDTILRIKGSVLIPSNIVLVADGYVKIAYDVVFIP